MAYILPQREQHKHVAVTAMSSFHAFLRSLVAVTREQDNHNQTLWNLPNLKSVTQIVRPNKNIS